MSQDLLLELIAKQPNDYAAIEALIRQAEAKEEGVAPLKDLLIAQHLDTQETSLHLACQQGDTRLISLLLSAGADIDVLNRSGKKPVACVSGNDIHQQKKIFILFRLHQKMLQQAKEFNINLPRTLFLMTKAHSSVMGETEALIKPCVLLVGDTKKGKSTLVNLLKNIEYEPSSSDVGMVPVDGMKEPAEVSANGISMTFTPAAYDMGYCTVIDMPGLTDNREPGEDDFEINPYEVAASLGNSLLASKISTINTLGLVIEMNDLVASNIENILKPFRKIARLLSQHPDKILEQTLLIITKKDLVAPRLTSVPPATHLARCARSVESLLPSGKEKEIIQKIFEHFINPKNAHRIVVSDLNDETRQTLYGHFKQSTLMPSWFINLNDYSQQLAVFRKLIESLSPLTKNIETFIEQKQQKLEQCRQGIARTRQQWRESVKNQNFYMQQQMLIRLESYREINDRLQEKINIAQDELSIAHQLCLPITTIRDIVIGPADNIPSLIASQNAVNALDETVSYSDSSVSSNSSSISFSKALFR